MVMSMMMAVTLVGLTAVLCCCCVLQRLCEELEYSELLDRVVEISDPFERMVSFSHPFFSDLLEIIDTELECVEESVGTKSISPVCIASFTMYET